MGVSSPFKKVKSSAGLSINVMIQFLIESPEEEV